MSGRTGVGLGARALELEGNEGFVTNDPGVVTGLEHVRVAGADLDLGTVFVRQVQTARDDCPDVTVLAAVAADDGLDALGPLPARLCREASGFHAFEIDDVEGRLVRCPLLIG